MESGATFIEIVPFSDDHLEEAARLVASRYRLERKRNPILPALFEDAAAVMPLLNDHANGQAGVAAIRKKQLIGFMVGLYVSGRKKMAYVPDWGHVADSTGIRDIYSAMYVELAGRWVADGFFSHAITLLAYQRETIDTWLSLGFGMIEIDALRDTSPIEGEPSEIEIRRAGLEEIDLVLDFRVALQRHIATAPVFVPFLIHRGGTYYQKWLPDSTNALWLAYHGGDAVAFMEVEPVNKRGAAILFLMILP